MFKKKVIWVTFPILFLFGLYFLGPQPDEPVFDLTLPEVPADPDALENFVRTRESQHKIKPENEAEIVWFDSARNRTEYAVLYLHGFSASKIEGDPVHRRFAKEFGCNLYLSRLADHGVDTTETLMLFTADRFWRSAVEALTIATKLGKKVIVMSTSSGSSVALKLAAEYPELVHSLITMSPNIEINHPAAFIANNPWGLYIGRLIMNGNYRVTSSSEDHARYWNKKYRLESVVQLQELLETTMIPETFHRIKQPSLTLYYFKNDVEQDPEVRVDAIVRMNDELGTPTAMKEAVAIPGAGAHVIGSSLTSHDVPAVYDAIKKFALEKLEMKPVIQ
jgi:esterase/lipase